LKEKYGNKKGSLPKSDRLSLVHDCEYLGERVPFYNTPPDEESGSGSGSSPAGKKKLRKLAFPSKSVIWERAPAWMLRQPSPKNQDVIDRVKDLEDRKFEEMTKKFEEKKIDTKGDVIKSFDRMDHLKKLYFQYHQPLKKTDQYEQWKEKAPSAYPGPQQYFKTPVQTFEKKKKNKLDASGSGSDDEKIHYVDRRKADKMVYKPMKSHIF